MENVNQINVEDKEKFCHYWPIAKGLLTLAKNTIKTELIKKAIDDAIQWGDKIYNNIGCKNTQ